MRTPHPSARISSRLARQPLCSTRLTPRPCAADFPSLALEEEGRGDDYDVRRREALQAKYHSQGPVVFDQERDDPRLRWKGHVRAPWLLASFVALPLSMSDTI